MHLKNSGRKVSSVNARDYFFNYFITKTHEDSIECLKYYDE
jgi:hypothetical protein